MLTIVGSCRPLYDTTTSEESTTTFILLLSTAQPTAHFAFSVQYCAGSARHSVLPLGSVSGERGLQDLSQQEAASIFALAQPRSAQDYVAKISITGCISELLVVSVRAYS